MEYYFQIKNPADFRYSLISGVKGCLIIQREQEKLDLIRQAKKDLFKELKDEMKEIKVLSAKLDAIMMDDALKKEIKKEIKDEMKEAKQEVVFKAKTQNAKKSSKRSEVKAEHVAKNEEVVRAKKAVRESSEISSFEYTLDQIERKLSELKKI